MSSNQNKKYPVSYVNVSRDQADRRIDNFLFTLLDDLPKTRIYQMLRRGEVRVNSKRIRQDYRVQQGDNVRIPPHLTISDRTLHPPRQYQLDLVKNCQLYEDSDLLVINKPPGLAVHSGSDGSYGIIELLRYIRGNGAQLHLAHRLDKQTSGVLLIAKNHVFLRQMQAGFRTGQIKKHYIALLKGQMTTNQVKVDKPLQRNLVRDGERFSGISDAGKVSISRFQLLRFINQASLAEIVIPTGRTHQIRVHAAFIDHPIAGDDKYGDRIFNKLLKKSGLHRLFLHASTVQLPKNLLKKSNLFKAALPGDLETFLVKYEQARP